MDLELRRDVVSCFELVLDTTVCQEETQEAIVPDACPDILRILDCQAQGCLTGKQVRDGMVTVTGIARACVLYLPEAGEGVRRLDIAIPFTCQADVRDLTAQGSVVAVPRVRWAEARVLNPRKILVRVDLAVDIQAYQPRELELCCEVQGGEEQGIRQLVTEEGADVIAAVQEKPFTFSENMEFGFPGTDQGEVLGIRGEPHCSESKLIGSKLIFKGSVEVEALVGAGAELKAVRQSLPFSQIMEVAGAGENSDCEVRVALADLSLQDLESMSGSGEVNLELLAQAVVRERRQVTILRDLYSTSFLTETKTATYLLCHTLDQGTRVVPVRELMETTTMVRSVCHCWADLGEVQSVREGEQVVLTADVQLAVLYLDDGEQLQSVHKTFPVQCRLDVPAGGICHSWCAAPRELYVSPAAGGAEVRFSLDFNSQILVQQQITGISAASLGEERPRGDGSQPSIILRMAAPGERLWDIAKIYGTTADEITQANELEEGELPVGKMLLIPKVR